MLEYMSIFLGQFLFFFFVQNCLHQRVYDAGFALPFAAARNSLTTACCAHVSLEPRGAS